jgi:small subunit ribosomal protein S3
VGQTQNPTGVRIGINKSQSATWFANYQAYSQVLEEDQKIRDFFQKEWSLLYNKAGISKVERKRKVNQIELLIDAARPKVISGSSEEEGTFLTVRTKLKKIVSPTKQIRIKLVQIAKTESESSLIARSLADQLEKRVAFKKAMRQVANRLQKNNTPGFKLQISGRLNGAEMARAEWLREGRVPLQTLRADISYATARAYTTYGVLGIKVWIFSKEII